MFRDTLWMTLTRTSAFFWSIEDMIQREVPWHLNSFPPQRLDVSRVSEVKETRKERKGALCLDNYRFFHSPFSSLTNTSVTSYTL